MKELNISITKAQITRFSVELRQDKPEVTATITLLTESSQKITDYTISTNHWDEVNKFDLPGLMIPPILGIMEQLEQIVVKHCNEHQKLLAEGESNG